MFEDGKAGWQPHHPSLPSYCHHVLSRLEGEITDEAEKRREKKILAKTTLIYRHTKKDEEEKCERPDSNWQDGNFFRR